MLKNIISNILQKTQWVTVAWEELELTSNKGVLMGNNPYDELLTFWFNEESEKLWFNSTKEFDVLLKQKYESLYEEAAKGKLDRWRDSPEGSLALIILLDQIPLNIYRNQAKSFETEAQAREIAGQAIANKQDENLPDKQKMFLYLPFMHSESLNDQETSVALFENAGLNENAKYARHHKKIVSRFGRFPHRNDALGRESTKEELEYLASDGAFTG